MRAFEYRHVVSLQETNMLGNVYFTNHLQWQGRCREMFLMQHAPAVLEEFATGLSLVTVKVECEYYEELRAFDELLICMRVKDLTPGRVTMTFDYVRVAAGSRLLVARGEQQVASMRREQERAVPIPLPAALREALAEFNS
jgi:enediyne core biosynthesis thioesterase